MTTTTHEDAPRFLTLGEVAERLRLAPKTLLAWIADGRLSARFVGRRYLVPASEVARVLGLDRAAPRGGAP